MIMTFEKIMRQKTNSKFLLKVKKQLKNILKNKVRNGLVSNSSNYTKDVVVFFDGLYKINKDFLSRF